MNTNPNFSIENKKGFNGVIPLIVTKALEVESRGIVNGRLSFHFDFENGQLINIDTERARKGIYNDK
ncbi:MAG: hypothetical protein FWG07_09965 [Treponema sp.]|nr:hypothetical protein [Treponema sp.]